MLYPLLKPLLFRLDPERAHELTGMLLGVAGRSRLGVALLRALFAYEHPTLAVTCAGLTYMNPIGLAAGFDKRATLVQPLGLLGFGHVEVGTVTPRPQPGNPRPRLFRLPDDQGLINRLGFNSPGMLRVARKLRRARLIGVQDRQLIVGVNIGKNRETPLDRAVEDYLAAFVALAPLADYVTINISSPNTPGLRRLHERDALDALLAALARANAPIARPLFLKVSPDEPAEQLDMVAEAALRGGASGLIATNTTLARGGLLSAHQAQAGGLSGRPLTPLARQTIGRLYAATEGRLPLIGAGGVMSAEDAYAHIRAGATLVQLYTGLIYAGPGLVRSIKRGLVRLLEQDGFDQLADAVGAAHRARR